MDICMQEPEQGNHHSEKGHTRIEAGDGRRERSLNASWVECCDVARQKQGALVFCFLFPNHILRFPTCARADTSDSNAGVSSCGEAVCRSQPPTVAAVELESIREKPRGGT